MSEAADAVRTLARYEKRSLGLDPDTTFDEWLEIGAALQQIEASVQWWIGDWYRFGEHRYGHAADQALPTGFAVRTVQNAAWVADRIAPERRREDVTFEHHAAVAGLDPDDQDVLLDRAAREHLTRDQLRTVVRDRKADREGETRTVWWFVCADCGEVGPHLSELSAYADVDRRHLGEFLRDHRTHQVLCLPAGRPASRLDEVTAARARRAVDQHPADADRV